MPLPGQRKGLSPPSTLGTSGEGCNISFLKVSAPVFDSCTNAISDGDGPGIQMRLGVEEWSAVIGAWSRARATFKCQWSGFFQVGPSPTSSTARSSLIASRHDYLSSADRRRFLILFLRFPTVLKAVDATINPRSLAHAFKWTLESFDFGIGFRGTL